MNATWKSWLNRLMNRGAGAVRALGFTTRRPSRMLRMPRMRMALGALALSGALGTTAWGQTPAGDGVVKLGGGAARVTPAQGVGLGDPSGAMVAAPTMAGQVPPQLPPGAYIAPYNPYQQAPRNPDRTWQNYEQGMNQGVSDTPRPRTSPPFCTELARTRAPLTASRGTTPSTRTSTPSSRWPPGPTPCGTFSRGPTSPTRKRHRQRRCRLPLLHSR